MFNQIPALITFLRNKFPCCSMLHKFFGAFYPAEPKIQSDQSICHLFTAAFEVERTCRTLPRYRKAQRKVPRCHRVLRAVKRTFFQVRFHQRTLQTRKTFPADVNSTAIPDSVTTIEDDCPAIVNRSVLLGTAENKLSPGWV